MKESQSMKNTVPISSPISVLLVAILALSSIAMSQQAA